LLDAKRIVRLVKIYLKFPKNTSIDKKYKLRTLVIEVEYGGLGDNLFYSHIPRIAKESGNYDFVYLSNATPFRRESHKDFIWGKNPFLDGYCNSLGESARTTKRMRTSANSIEATGAGNILDQIMLKFGLDDGKRFHSPEVYYKPKLIESLKNAVIFDPNFVTGLYDEASIYDSVRHFFSVNMVTVDFQFEPRIPNGWVIKKESLIRDSDFENFCDIVYSCSAIYCFASGTAALADALGKKAYVFYSDLVDEIFLFSNLHSYIKLAGMGDK